MAVNFYNEQCDYLPPGRKNIARWIREVIQEEGYGVGDISYVFCAPEYHRQTNKEYLDHDYSTDVITFDYSDLRGDKIISGDILIDPETVVENAVVWKTEADEEMRRVIIHGVLHLCGYGDKSDDEQQIMRAKEDYYLAKFSGL